MTDLTAAQLLQDPQYGAAMALNRWPDNVKRKGEWQTDWAPWINHGLRNGLALCLPIRLMGYLEVFDEPDGRDQRSSRQDGRFLIGGTDQRVLYLAINLKRRGMLGTTYANGVEYDSVHAEDRDNGGWGWIVAQFTQFGLPKICVGFTFHKPRNKAHAVQQAQLFLGALNGA